MQEPRATLSLNDETDYGLCFACGPRNPSGLRLRFDRDGDKVTTTFQAREEYQGFPGYLHGGIITTLLDEVMSRVSLLDDRWTFTARMDVRFRRPIPPDARVVATAWKSRARRKHVEVQGRVELPDGSVAAEAEGKYVFVRPETLAQMGVGYPRLAQEWMRGEGVGG